MPGSLFKIKREEFLGYGVVEVKKKRSDWKKTRKSCARRKWSVRHSTGVWQIGYIGMDRTIPEGCVQLGFIGLD